MSYLSSISKITSLISEEKIPQNLIETQVNIVAKASFGFGDVNGCILFKKFKL